MRVCVIVAYAKDNIDKATLGLTLANAAVSAGEQVSVVLISEGVRLAVQGYADGIDYGEPFKPMQELVAGVLKGGEVSAHRPCMKKRGISEEFLLPGVRLVGGADVIRLIGQADRSLQL